MKLKKGKWTICKLKKSVRRMLCIALSTAMIFADTPLLALPAETEDKTKTNAAEQDEETDSEEAAVDETETETKTEQPSTEETALETETEELSTIADDAAESEAEEGTQELLFADTDIDHGTYKDITWVIDTGGKLTVKGTGDFSDKTGKNRVPWTLNGGDIKSAEIIVSGITDASYMFEGCSRLKTSKLTEPRLRQTTLK